MEEQWAELFAELAAPGLWGNLYTEVVAAYASPGRHYHNLAHIGAVLRTVSWLCEQPSPALRLAVWLHDIVYDTRANDNEERSADYARRVLAPLSVPPAIIDETARLVLLTKAHQADAADRAGQVLLDADLAILGAEEAEYEQYARAIRQEYEWVPQERYRAGRAEVLEGFLRRPRIYHTDAMFSRAEDQARRNLAREARSLRGG
jgi:predicted metal-dependent HD superfamily phosphohydrolase